MNNLLFEASDFTTSGWEVVEINLVPEENGILFLGWHATSPDGYGVFLDDITIEAGITTNINETSTAEARIYSTNGNLRIEANENWTGADLLVINLMGQVVYDGEYFQPMTIQMKTQKGAGLYFVTLRKDSKVLIEKIIFSGD